VRFGMQEKLDAYPGELSGGEKRRISVVRTLLTQPRLVVADEPTSGLDASVKADVLDAILAAKSERTAYIFISHDLDVIRFVSDRILVMYRGRIVEEMEKDRIDPALPHHPYTLRLFEAARADIPSDEEANALAEGEQAPPQTGGCPYRPLCPLYRTRGSRDQSCDREVPALVPLAYHQKVACHVLVMEHGGTESSTLPANSPLRQG
jgi:peptide/nickel transport system ATP-binding protein